MASRRRAVLLVTLSMVTGLHIIVIWLLVSSPRLLIRTKSGSLQLVRIPRSASIESTPHSITTTQSPSTIRPRHHEDRGRAPLAMAPRAAEQDSVPMPDWTEELKRAARNAVADQLAQKRHDADFAHSFPAVPKKTEAFAWDYAATHRIEAIPGGGMLVHLNDNCVLIIFPFPFVGCGIGKRAANGDLFEHRQEN